MSSELRYKLKTAPTFYPVTIERLKRNLRIDEDDNSQDYYLEEIIESVTNSVQTSIGRQIARATYIAYLDDFDEELELTLGPVNEINSIKYYDTSNQQQTMSASDYILDNSELTARLRFLQTYSVYPERFNAIEIEFENGWEKDEIPAELKDAIVLLCTERYLNPENDPQSFGSGLRISAAERILKKYRVQRY